MNYQLINEILAKHSIEFIREYNQALLEILNNSGKEALREFLENS
jgi:hypothetical protein